jgi:hemoglobin
VRSDIFLLLTRESDRRLLGTNRASEFGVAEPVLRQDSMFERIGGALTVDRIVETFYTRMGTLPEAKEIRMMHPVDLDPIKQVLKRYLCEWMGGPELYSAERGHPRLRQRHLGFRIGEAERDAWLLCMHGALEQSVENAAARQEISRRWRSSPTGCGIRPAIPTMRVSVCI